MFVADVGIPKIHISRRGSVTITPQSAVASKTSRTAGFIEAAGTSSSSSSSTAAAARCRHCDELREECGHLRIAYAACLRERVERSSVLAIRRREEKEAGSAVAMRLLEEMSTESVVAWLRGSRHSAAIASLLGLDGARRSALRIGDDGAAPPAPSPSSSPSVAPPPRSESIEDVAANVASLEVLLAETERALEQEERTLRQQEQPSNGVGAAAVAAIPLPPLPSAASALAAAIAAAPAPRNPELDAELEWLRTSLVTERERTRLLGTKLRALVTS